MLDESPSCIAMPPRLPERFDLLGQWPTPRPPRLSKDAIIWGVTAGGRAFRPSDWAERLAGLTSAYGLERRLAYSPLVRPMIIGGVKVVVIGATLAALEPRFYQFLLQFARDNELVCEFVDDALVRARTLEPPASRAAAPGERPVEAL